MEQSEFDELLDNIRCSVFHMNDEEAKSVIDLYISHNPKLLEMHDREWYYKNC